MEYTVILTDEENQRLATALGKKKDLGRDATESEIKDSISAFLKRVVMRSERSERFKALIVPPTPINPS